MKLFKNFNLDKLKQGLSKTRDKIVNKITETFSGKAVLDDNYLEELEEILLTSDIGANMAAYIIEQLKVKMKDQKERTPENLFNTLKQILTNILLVTEEESIEKQLETYKPYIIVIVGVNGVGKTTSIGKLANNYRKSGLSVIVGACDTFRAAANEQLNIWAERAGVEIISSKHGSDPSSVAFETIQTAIKKKTDIVIIDTAGRLHNKVNLMNELQKIKKVIQKLADYAPNEVLLVIDGTTGQNAINQATEFMKSVNMNGLIITKLDGTAKGGSVFQIVNSLRIPIKYIGIGEGIDDLQNFDPTSYINSIFNI